MEKITAIQVLDVPVHPYSMDAAVQYLDDKIQEQKHSFVVTANAEIIMMCQDDAEYKNILTNVADLVLPDGELQGLTYLIVYLIWLLRKVIEFFSLARRLV